MCCGAAGPWVACGGRLQMPAPHFASISTLLPKAPQASVPRADPSAQSAERLMRGGKIGCFSYRLQAVVEPASPKCSTLPMDPSTGENRRSVQHVPFMPPRNGSSVISWHRYVVPLPSTALGTVWIPSIFGPRAFRVIGQNSDATAATVLL